MKSFVSLLYILVLTLLSCSKENQTSTVSFDTTYNKFKICNKMDFDLQGAIGHYFVGVTGGYEGITKGFIFLPKGMCTDISGFISDRRIETYAGNWYLSNGDKQFIPNNVNYDKSADSIMCLPDANENRSVITGVLHKDSAGHVINSISCENNKRHGWGVELDGFAVDDDPSYTIYRTLNITKGYFLNADGTMEALPTEQKDKVRYEIKTVKDILNLIDKRRLEMGETLEEWQEQLAEYLNLDMTSLDPDELIGIVPQWFIDLVRNLQKDQEKTIAELQDLESERQQRMTEDQITIKNRLEEFGSELELEDIETRFDLDFEDGNGDDSSDPAFQQLIARENKWLDLLEGKLNQEDRIGFLQNCYDWHEESKISHQEAIQENILTPGYYLKFQESQARIGGLISEHVDEYYYFRDVAVSNQFKKLLDGDLKRKNPIIAKKIRDQLNKRPIKGGQAVLAVAHLETIASQYAYEPEPESSRLEESLIDDILAFLEASVDIVSCIAKTEAAPLYAAFYELFEGKGFCDGEDLDFFDRGIAGIEFAAEGASKIGIKAASGASLILGLKRIFRIAAPIFRKMKSGRFGQIVDMLMDVGSSLSGLTFENLIPKISGIFSSAMEIGVKNADDISSFANLSSKFGKNADEVADAVKSGSGKIGHDFEDHLAGKLGGQRSFKSGGREFDGAVGNAWYEAKSGRYWEDIYSSNPNKFKEDMGSRLRIARDNGKSYHLISNTPIPQDAKDWLIKKGITYVDLSN